MRSTTTSIVSLSFLAYLFAFSAQAQRRVQVGREFGEILFDCSCTGNSKQEQPRSDSKNYKIAEIGYSASISQDGQILVYADSDGEFAEDHVFVLDRRTGQKRRLTRSGSGEEIGDLRASRDGRQVVYEWLRRDGTRELRLLKLSDGTDRMLYKGGKDYRWMDGADWSPDGSHIVASLRTTDGVSQLGLLPTRDGSLRVLKTVPGGSGSMRFSPDGRHVAYTARLPGHEERVFALSLEDGTEFKLENPGGDHFLIDWLPDGKRLLFGTNEKGQATTWIADVTCGRAPRQARLAPVQLPPVESSLGFTADGSLYYTRQHWTNDLYIVAYDPATGNTGDPAKVAETISFGSAAQWSPDGKHLAYFRGKGHIEDLFTLALRDASGIERMLDVGRLTRFGGHDIQPHWAADSRSLLVQGRDRDFTAPGKDSQGLYHISVENGEVEPILQTRSLCPPDCVEWLIWLRDGRAVFMKWLPPSGTSREPFKVSIMALEIESRKEKLIYQAKPTGRVSHLAASPDGKYLAFVEEESDITSPESHFRRRSTIAIKTLSLDGGAPKELVRLPSPVLSTYGQPIFELAWTPDSKFIIYAPTTAGQQRRFELWRVPRIGGEPERLSVALDGLLPYGLSVHPSGDRIAFTAGTELRTEVWVLENFLPRVQERITKKRE